MWGNQAGLLDDDDSTYAYGDRPFDFRNEQEAQLTLLEWGGSSPRLRK